jgi:hypothetical protein
MERKRKERSNTIIGIFLRIVLIPNNIEIHE